MDQAFFNAISSYNNAISNAQANLKAGVTTYKGGKKIYAPDYAARQNALNQAIQNKSNYINQYPENAAKNPDPYMSDSFTPTDWGKKVADYNAQIDALKKQGMTWGEYNLKNNKSPRGGPDTRSFRLNDGVQAQIDELTLQRDNLPTLIAAENAGIGAAKVVKQRNADIQAEDLQIQERAQSRNRMANDTLARMNQRQVADDSQNAASKQGTIDSGGRGVGPAYDIQKQREAGQQKVGAAMSAAPGVSAFAGKANAVSPINATAQTANTGVMQGLNKSLDLGQLVAQRANKDQAAASQFSSERSKAQNVGQANSFTPPNMQGIQIGETPIGKFGGS